MKVKRQAGSTATTWPKSRLLSTHSVMSNSLRPPWTAARQASLTFTFSRSVLKHISIELVMPSNQLVLCRTLLLLPFPASVSFPKDDGRFKCPVVQPKGLPSGSVVKNPPAMLETQEMRVRSLDWDDTLEEGMATHSSIHARKIPWTPWGHSQTRLQWLSTHTQPKINKRNNINIK